jgi:hypothetical protein
MFVCTIRTAVIGFDDEVIQYLCWWLEEREVWKSSNDSISPQTGL